MIPYEPGMPMPVKKIVIDKRTNIPKNEVFSEKQFSCSSRELRISLSFAIMIAETTRKEQAR